MYTEKMYRYKNPTFGTILEAIKNWMVGRPEKNSETQGYFVHNAVQSKIKSKIGSIVQSRVQSQGCVPTPPHQLCLSDQEVSTYVIIFA